MENEEKVMTNEAAQQNTTEAPIVPAQIEEKKGLVAWAKKHKKTILGGLAAVGGGLVCFVLGAMSQKSADSVEDDRDLYDSDGNYEPQVYELGPENESDEDDEAV